jgi:hypothetical protein
MQASKYWQYASEKARTRKKKIKKRARKKRIKKKQRRPRHPHVHQSIKREIFSFPFSVKNTPLLNKSTHHLPLQRQSPHIPRTQPSKSIRAVSSTASETLEVSALVAHMPGAVDGHVLLRHLLLLLLLLERVHVAAQRHRGAALGSLHLLLLLLRDGNAVFGERLERSLGSELRVVVEGENGGFVGSGRVGLVLLLLRWELLLLWLLWLLLLLVLGHAGLLRGHLLLRLLWLLLHLLLHLLLRHTGLLRSHLCLPERILRGVLLEALSVLLLLHVHLRLVALRLLLGRRLLRRAEEIFLLAVDGWW